MKSYKHMRLLSGRMMLAAFVMFLSLHARAQQGYAVVSADKTTLTFYYGTPTGRKNVDYYDTDNTSPQHYSINHGWNDCRSTLTTVIFDSSYANARPRSCANWFYFCQKLTTIEGIENLNTSNVTSMASMFNECRSLTSLDLSHFDTSNVTNMIYMFVGCVSLTSLDLSTFDTSNVTDMSHMFNACLSLTSLDLSHFDTSKVTKMDNMFHNCRSLTSLDVSHFDTSKVTSMTWMFYNCSLTSLDVSHFDTSKVVSMTSMFKSCSSLTSLTFGKKFSTDNVNSNSCNNMFYDTDKLRYIDFYASDDTDAITSAKYLSMFARTPVTAVIYLPHGSKEVTNRQNVVYSYGGNQNDLRCPKYYSEDKVDIELPRNFKTQAAEYKRTMSNSYGSVVLPYAFTTNSNIQAYTLNAEYTGMMYFKDVKTVAAHTPFAFKKLASGTEAIFTMTNNNFGITVYATRSTNAAEDTWTGTKGSPYTAGTNLSGWMAKGYYVTEIVNDYSDAYYIANEKFYKADGALTMYPHRVTFHGAWTKGTGNAKFFDIETGDDEVITAIEAAETEQTLREATGIYDASGRRQTAVRKGLNIVRMSDGTVKKVIVK